MSEFSAEVKARADLATIVGETMALRKTTNGWIGLCPFHAEKTPSFHIHAARQFYYCFGCHAHGDVFAFLMATQKLAFFDAVRAVAERLGMPVPAFSGEGDGGERPLLLKIHAAVAEFFAQQLRVGSGAAARAYLAGRGVGKEAIARFQLGYAPGEGRALSEFLRRDFEPRLAVTAGVCQWRRESGDGEAGTAPTSWEDVYDRFRGRVMFPIANERGQVIAFGGRDLNQEAHRAAPKYLNSPETPIYTKGRALYNLDRARETMRTLGYFILVEGYFDCLAVFMAGFHNVVASCGTALTQAQVGLLRRQVQNAVINFDPDAAGAGAAEKSIGLLLEEDCKIRVIALPGGLDPDQFVRQRGAAAYGEALQASQPFFDFLAGRARRAFDVRRAEGRVGALNFLLPYLARVRDGIIRAELADEMATQLGVENALERQRLRRAVSLRRGSLPAPASSAVETSDWLPAEAVVIRALWEWEEQRASLAALLRSESLLEGLATAPLLDALAAQAGALDVAAMAGRLSPADRQLVAAIVLPATDPLDEAAVSGAVEGLRDRRMELRRRHLKLEVQDAENKQNWNKLKDLLSELRELDLVLARRRSEFRLERRTESRPLDVQPDDAQPAAVGHPR